MKRLVVFLIGAAIVLVIVCNLGVATKQVRPAEEVEKLLPEAEINKEEDTATPAETIAPSDAISAETVSVPIEYDPATETWVLQEVEQAVQAMPAEAVEDFIKEGWKIVITGKEQPYKPEWGCEDAGYIDYEQRTVWLSYKDRPKGQMLVEAVHELCHFASAYTYHPFYNLPVEPCFEELRDNFWDGYVEYEYSTLEKPIYYSREINYGSVHKEEFYAMTFKDFLLHPDYQAEHYPDIYLYFVQQKPSSAYEEFNDVQENS